MTAKVESYYYNGWHNDGQGVIWHTGLNPNYTQPYMPILKKKFVSDPAKEI